MSIPHILRAIPKRRYQYGEFIISVLGEIESDDQQEYRYILAVAQEGNPQPGLFINCERNRGGDGDYAMRVAMADGDQVIATGNELGDIDLFVKQGLDIIATMLDLSDEMPHRLM